MPARQRRYRSARRWSGRLATMSGCWRARSSMANTMHPPCMRYRTRCNCRPAPGNPNGSSLHPTNPVRPHICRSSTRPWRATACRPTNSSWSTGGPILASGLARWTHGARSIRRCAMPGRGCGRRCATGSNTRPRAASVEAAPRARGSVAQTISATSARTTCTAPTSRSSDSARWNARKRSMQPPWWMATDRHSTVGTAIGCTCRRTCLSTHSGRCRCTSSNRMAGAFSRPTRSAVMRLGTARPD